MMHRCFCGASIIAATREALQVEVENHATQHESGADKLNVRLHEAYVKIQMLTDRINALEKRFDTLNTSSVISP